MCCESLTWPTGIFFGCCYYYPGHSFWWCVLAAHASPEKSCVSLPVQYSSCCHVFRIYTGAAIDAPHKWIIHLSAGSSWLWRQPGLAWRVLQVKSSGPLICWVVIVQGFSSQNLLLSVFTSPPFPFERDLKPGNSALQEVVSRYTFPVPSYLELPVFKSTYTTCGWHERWGMEISDWPGTGGKLRHQTSTSEGGDQNQQEELQRSFDA